MKQPEPKTLVFDIETSLDILAAYGLKEQYHSPSNIIQDWFVICVAWKWLGCKRVYDFSILDDIKRWVNDHSDDYAVVKRLHEVLSDAEIIVGHNVQNFDWKKFMARVIYHGLPPIDRPLIVDTLKEARKIAKFTSNKMDYLAKHLKIENKLHHAPDMWLRILRGEAAAVKEAVKYCRGDIATTEALYLRLRPYMASHPNRNLWRGDGIECCPKCGGEHLNKHKARFTTTGKYMQYHCQDCGGYCQGTKRIKAVKIK